MIKAMDLSLLFVAVFLAIVLIGLMALSRRSLIASLIASVISLGFSGFCVFGFMACYEPSNSLVRLWQLAYAVFVFAPELWPDFDGAAFDAAIDAFKQRQRRFGMSQQQVEVQGA